MASSATKPGHEVVCPDPSAHDKSSKLQDQASKAALYVTQSGQSSSSGSKSQSANPLGPDGKLSSAGAATSLKYAKPHELPSHPSVGIDTKNSGNKAALLANSQHKDFEYWKPELSTSAGKAATLAAKDGGKLNLWEYKPTGQGLGAATIAMNKGNGMSPQLDRGYTEDGRKKALQAATISSSGSRTRAPSNPTQPKLYPDAENSTFNAQNAASVAHRPSQRSSQDTRMSDKANEASRITHMRGMSREMFTEHPPVAPETDELRSNAAMHASAVSMAKQMQDDLDTSVAPQGDIRTQAKQYLHLQEAAQKLAAERLAKLDPDGVMAYREHYGYSNNQSKNTKGSTRTRKQRKPMGAADSDSSDDEMRAGKIRNQMSQFNTSLADVDAQKRTTDRASLMAAAERSVHKQIMDMDQQVFLDTGKVTPAMMDEWEAKAKARAEADSSKRTETVGMVHIGGGKYMSQTEIDAIAAARMQPTLDEINASTERQRARDAEIKRDQQERKTQNALEKDRQREEKAEQKRQKDEEKELRKHEKMDKTLREQELKEKRRNEKAAQKEEEQRVKDGRVAEAQAWEKEKSEAVPVTKQRDSATLSKLTRGNEDDAVAAKASKEPEDPKLPRPANELSVGEKAAHSEQPEDPPGVPTAFVGETLPTAASTKPTTEHANPVAAEPTTTSTAVGSPTTNGDDNTKLKKRDSRLGGFFGKFKRSSKAPGSFGGHEEPDRSVAPTVKTESKLAAVEPPTAVVATETPAIVEPTATTTHSGLAASEPPEVPNTLYTGPYDPSHEHVGSPIPEVEPPTSMINGLGAKTVHHEGALTQPTHAEDPEESRDTFDSLGAAKADLAGSSEDVANRTSKFSEEL